MRNIDAYFDAIDSARIQRARELSEIKFRFRLPEGSDPYSISSKAAVVLTYANWEGFYNDCVSAYLSFLKEGGKKIRDTDWLLLVGAISSDIYSLRDRNHSMDAMERFVLNLKDKIECKFDEFDEKVISSKSNLNFERISQTYRLMNFDLNSMKRYRIRLDKELVGWRHGVAHGGTPDLSSMDISDHIDFVSNLLIVVADNFQTGMLERV